MSDVAPIIPIRHDLITLDAYWKGRDAAYAKELTATVRRNANVTVTRVNRLLLKFYSARPFACVRTVNSGWRPESLNARIANAALRSRHVTGEAIDLSDDDGELDRWCLLDDGQAMLVEVGLWMEHPNATPRWCHLQTVAPRSGRRVFFP